MPRTVDILAKVAPRAKTSYLEAFDQGDALLAEHGIDTPQRLAHFLAQVLHETGGLRIDWENMSYSAARALEVFGAGRHSAALTAREAQDLAFNPPAIAERVYGLGNPRKARELGNLQPGDGYLYRGGGLMQTTGRANYRTLGARCGVGFEACPELVLSAEHALKPALAEWSEKDLNRFADRDDLLAISRGINIGNVRSGATPNGLADRRDWLAKVRPLVNGIELGAPPTSGNGAQARTGTDGATTANGEPPRNTTVDARTEITQLQETLGKMAAQLAALAAEVTRAAQAAGTGADAARDAGPWKDIAASIGVLAAEVTTRVRHLADGVPSGSDPPASAGSARVGSLTALLGDDMLEQGDSGEKVRQVQLALARLGYRLNGTGFFGGATDTAVSHFQRAHQLEVDGVVGPQTAGAIDRQLAGGNGAGNSGSDARQPGPVEARDNERPLWLLEGLKWINTVEEPGAGDNPAILQWAREEGGAIAASYQRDSVPWCALFANMILTKVGIKGTETLWALDWAKWGRALAGPAVGAFVPMKRDGGGHIAVVVGRDQHGNLMCLGGNQSDAVNIKPFPLARPVGFRWPLQVPLPGLIGVDSLPLVRSDGRLSRNEG